MRFTKMHGCGNEFLILDAIEDPSIARDQSWRTQVPELCGRRYAMTAGADGVILVRPSTRRADAHAEIINADGSPGGMCGNGIRCVARLLIERARMPRPAQSAGGGRSDALTIEMDERLIAVHPRFDGHGQFAGACADMGPPIVDLASIPVHAHALTHVSEHAWRIPLAEQSFNAVFVSMGNPHAVLFVEELPDHDTLTTWGPALEHHPAFPQRMNIHWVRTIDAHNIRAVTWERGAGPTRACGTGACAIAVAGALLHRTAHAVNIHMPGGTLDVRQDTDGAAVWLGGPAATLFDGDWTVASREHASISSRA